MINIRKFEKALKLTWLRTFINETPDWSEFAYNCKIDKLLYTELEYQSKILIDTKNKFWKRLSLQVICTSSPYLKMKMGKK